MYNTQLLLTYLDIITSMTGDYMYMEIYTKSDSVISMCNYLVQVAIRTCTGDPEMIHYMSVPFLCSTFVFYPAFNEVSTVFVLFFGFFGIFTFINSNY